MLKLGHIVVALLFGVLISGCEAGGGSSTSENIGSGPIRLSSDVKGQFDAYRKRSFPIYFAVSVDGKSEGHGFCNNGYTCGQFSQESYVIGSCESNSGGVPCKIYAIGKKIVWKLE